MTRAHDVPLATPAMVHSRSVTVTTPRHFPRVRPWLHATPGELGAICGSKARETDSLPGPVPNRPNIIRDRRQVGVRQAYAP